MVDVDMTVSQTIDQLLKNIDETWSLNSKTFFSYIRVVHGFPRMSFICVKTSLLRCETTTVCSVTRHQNPICLW